MGSAKKHPIYIFCLVKPRHLEHRLYQWYYSNYITNYHIIIAYVDFFEIKDQEKEVTNETKKHQNQNQIGLSALPVGIPQNTNRHEQDHRHQIDHL